MAKYDFLIVGAGFFGATCARLLTDLGYKCLIIEKEKTVGGLCSDYFKDDINIHNYSAHVFHTSNEDVWSFINKYAKLNIINYPVKTLNENKYFDAQANMNFFNSIYGYKNPAEAQSYINKDIIDYGCEYRRNLEEEAISKGGFKYYINSIKGYYEKIYNDSCKNLSTAYIKNILNDFTFNTNYFSDKYIAIPEEGYTKTIENIIGDDIDILLNTDFLKNREKFIQMAELVICTCPIDKFCNYIYGALPWRSATFELKDFSKETNNFSGIGTIKVTDPNNGLLQIDEFKWLTPYKNSEEFNTHTYLMYTYPQDWNPDRPCIFSTNNDRSDDLLIKYVNFVSENFSNVVFGGRLGLFRNISISETIYLAMSMVNDIIDNIANAQAEIEAES